MFLLEVVVEFLEEFSCISVRTNLDELDAELDVRVRGATRRETQSAYLGEGCTRSIQSVSDVYDGTLGVVSCSPL